MTRIPSNLRSALHAILFFTLFIISSCKKHDHPPTSQTAEGSLQSESGSCLPGTVHGTWYAGMQIGGDSNYVDVAVNVTKTGSYQVVSDSVNGVKFSGSGNFTSTGLQLVRLKSSGKFSSVGVVSFNTSFNNSSCGFVVNVQVPPITNNTWRATIGGHLYWGSAQAVINFYPGDESWDFLGTVSGAPDTTVVMRVRMPKVDFGQEFVQLGTYRSSFVGARFLLQAAGVTYLHAEGAGPGIMIMMIDKVEHSGDTVQYEGKFSGTVKDDSGNITAITDGVFRAGSQ